MNILPSSPEQHVPNNIQHKSNRKERLKNGNILIRSSEESDFDGFSDTSGKSNLKKLQNNRIAALAKRNNVSDIDTPSTLCAASVEACCSAYSESEFDGFSDSSGRSKMLKLQMNRAAALSKQKSNRITPSQSSESDIELCCPARGKKQQATPPTPMCGLQSSADDACSSVEVSDQDVRFHREINKREFTLGLMVNKHLSDASSFSIEPNSSDDELSKTILKRDTSKTTVFSAENSCNAVDNKISEHTDNKSSIVTNELSFNGIIQTISKTNDDLALVAKKRALDMKLKLLESEQNLMHVNEQSPDMFGESDDSADEADTKIEDQFSGLDPIDESIADDRKHIYENEKIILNRIQNSLAGVLPPPSVTILQYDILEMLTLYKQNSTKFNYTDYESNDVPERQTSAAAEFNTCSNSSATSKTYTKCLFKPSHCFDDVDQMNWPQWLNVSAHGILYNRSVCSENIELFCMKYAERNIGAETSSSFTYTSPSSAKKRNMRMK